MIYQGLVESGASFSEARMLLVGSELVMVILRLLRSARDSQRQLKSALLGRVLV